MSGYINRTGNYQLEEFGVVHVAVRDGARSLRARWKGSRLECFAPAGVEADRLLAFLRSIAPRLEASRPRPMHSIGQRWEFPEFSIEMRRTPTDSLPHSLTIHRDDGNHYVVNVGSAVDLSAPSGCDVASRAICSVAKLHTAPILDRAREIARALDCRPSRFDISRGHRTLGRCDARGVISLSYVLALYPLLMRDYVICHELAHLTEMNHSAAFHVICDAYCRKITGSPESSLSRLTAAYRPPVVR